RTPGHDEELAAGFLLSEGLVRRREEILQIKAHPRNRQDNVLDVFLSPEVKVDFARLTRNVFVSSSCGLCGKATIEAVHQYFHPLRARVGVAPATMLALTARMRKRQVYVARTVVVTT